MIKAFRYSLCSLLVLGLFTQPLFAQRRSQRRADPTPTATPTATPTVAPTPEKKLPKSGVLSSTVSAGHSSKSVGNPWGDTDISGDEQAPISGSLTRSSPNEWLARVYNNSEDTYSVSLRVIQLDSRGNRAKSDSFAYTLKPKGSAERRVSANSSTTEASLMLDSWKKFPSKK